MLTQAEKLGAFALADRKSDLIYALTVDYPDLNKIPMYLRDAVFHELQKLGFLTWKWESYNRHQSSKGYYRIIYNGPRKTDRHYRPSSTCREDATSFKIIIFGMPGDDGQAP